MSVIAASLATRSQVTFNLRSLCQSRMVVASLADLQSVPVAQARRKRVRVPSSAASLRTLPRGVATDIIALPDNEFRVR